MSDIRYEIARWVHKRKMDIVWKLPKSLVYWCSIRLISNATTGEYCNTVVPNLTAMDALKRWGDYV